MTNNESVLAVYPDLCITDYGNNRVVIWESKDPFAKVLGRGKSTEAAWQNAAESLPAAPDQETDEKDDAWKSMVESILPEPVAPVEAQEKEPEVGFHCRWCDKPIFQNGDGTWYHRATVRTHCDRVAEPKPTPSVECNEQEFPGPIPSNCPKCGETIWGEGWNPKTGIRYFSHVPKPQPDSSSIPDHIVNAHEMVDSSSISTEQTFEDVLRNRAGEYQDMGREHRKNEEYAAACTCEDKASGLYVAIKLYRIWNAAKGQS